MKHSPSEQSCEKYEGVDNLQAMRKALRYNAYLTKMVLRGVVTGSKVLDFGAGLGDFARAVRSIGADVICVEPDRQMRYTLRFAGFQTARTLDEVADSTIDYLYSLNVLEHIEDDRAALTMVRRKLRAGGTALLYVPAFQCLYSSMDRRVGHFRRYTRRDLVPAVEAAGLRVVSSHYLDCMGFLASLVYRWLGRQDGGLSPRSVAFYDSTIFPVSMILDRLMGRWFGKNLLVIAELDRSR